MTAQWTGETRYAQLPDGRRLGYCEYGDLTGQPVFFFHGWIGSRLDFAPNDGDARSLGVRVVSVDRPGCGASDPQPRRRLLDWPEDVANLADTLGIDRFGVCGHSFGAPYVAACAYRLPGRVAAAAIVAGIAPVTVRGATRGMPVLVRSVLWAGARAPALTRPYVSLMAAVARKPDLIRKGMTSMLPPDERRLLDSERFTGFQEHLGEMVRDGSEGAYWDARAFLGPWSFDCAAIAVPVTLFYGTADKNVPRQMGEYYESTIPGATAFFYEGEGHFVIYSRAQAILRAAAPSPLG